MGTSAVAVGSTAAGAILIWSGLRGASVLKTFQEVVQGTKPTGERIYPIQTPQGASGDPSGATGGTGDASGMVALAVSQIGYREGAGNSNKYGKDLGWAMDAWCATFIVWLAKHTGNSGVIPHTASAPGMAQGFGSRYHTGTAGIEPGDIVFQHGASNGWGGIGHVGICVSSTKMVAGNYGDVVARYSWNTAKTVGYAKPGYKHASAPPATGHQADPARGE